MEHSRRIVFHFRFFKIEILCLIVGQSDLKPSIVVHIVTLHGPARWPNKNLQKGQLGITTKGEGGACEFFFIYLLLFSIQKTHRHIQHSHSTFILALKNGLFVFFFNRGENKGQRVKGCQKNKEGLGG